MGVCGKRPCVRACVRVCVRAVRACVLAHMRLQARASPSSSSTAHQWCARTRRRPICSLHNAVHYISPAKAA